MSFLHARNTHVGELDDTFLRETWILYGIGMIVLLLRFVARIKSVGLRGMQGDDIFSLLVAVWYTVDAVTVHIIYFTGTNLEAASLQAARPLTTDEIAQFEIGSKAQFLAWYSYTALIWCLKGTVLFFFKRMTTGLWQRQLVQWLMYACVVSYVAVLLTITFGCYPIYQNWQVVPDPGKKCTFRLPNFVVTVVLNVLTDGAILCIPLPILWRLQVPLKKKLAIGLLLCSGLFVISAAIIRVVLTLGENPSALNVNRWGVRETIVGIITVNVPVLWPMASRSFWTTNESLPYSSDLSGSGKIRLSGGGKSRLGTGTRTTTTATTTTLARGDGTYEMASRVGNGADTLRGHRVSFDDGGSEDFIIDMPDTEFKADDDVIMRVAFHVTVTSEEDLARTRRGEDWHENGGMSESGTAREELIDTLGETAY